MRYQYQALYELDSLAVINIRDLGPIKNAFKLMLHPVTRVLQCANSTDKVKLKNKIQIFFFFIN